ncbi:MAG: helix-turn-helix domain-containing protein [Dermatophilaceae bacterium]
MPSYAQFCPVAKAAELLCERWMPLILRELMCGSARFGEIQRGVPTLSPSLLARRLRQLEAAGVIDRITDDGRPHYQLTPAGWELFPLIEAMGVWGQRWARSDYSTEELDPAFLMWDIRRMVQAPGLSSRECVVEFWIRDASPHRSTYWMVVDSDSVDLCLVDPSKEVHLRVEAELRAITQVWMGDRTMPDAIAAGQITLLGEPRLAARFVTWLGRHPRLGGVARAHPTPTAGR